MAKSSTCESSHFLSTVKNLQPLTVYCRSSSLFFARSSSFTIFSALATFACSSWDLASASFLTFFSAACFSFFAFFSFSALSFPSFFACSASAFAWIFRSFSCFSFSMTANFASCFAFFSSSAACLAFRFASILSSTIFCLAFSRSSTCQHKDAKI